MLGRAYRIYGLGLGKYCDVERSVGRAVLHQPQQLESRLLGITEFEVVLQHDSGCLGRQ